MGSWTTNTPYPYAICGMGAVEYNGKIYIVGGHDLETGNYKDLISYDPAVGIGGSYNQTLSSLNTARYHYAIGLHGSTIIVAGGYDSSALNSVETYDIENPSAGWTIKEATMPEADYGCAGVIYGDYFYTFGGDTDKVYKCDINNNFSWSIEDTNIGVSRHPIAETVGDFIWVIGGFGDRTMVRKYNPSTNNWVSGSYTTAPSDVYTSVSCVRGTKIYIAGNLISTDFKSYDTSISTDPSAWEVLPGMGTAKYFMAGAVTNDNFYVMGGYGAAHNLYYDINESYDLPPLPTTNPGSDINPFRTRARQ